ncbi:MAG: hypothetical protein ACXWQO_02725 [Bdellovibrionota bacterium]
MNCRILPEHAGSAKLFPLYNVSHLISVKDGKPVVKKTGAGTWARLLDPTEVTERYFSARVKVSAANFLHGCKKE